ncbi:MAG: hypothetical protein AAGI52_10630 [Bacteroidota bacterium]
MITRIARWYGVKEGDLLMVAFFVILPAAAVAGWMLVDYGSPARALIGAIGALSLAIPPALTRHECPTPLALWASTAVLALSLGTLFFALVHNFALGYGFGAFLAVSVRAEDWAMTRAIRNDARRREEKRR